MVTDTLQGEGKRLDFLGHQSRIEDAMSRFDEPVNKARKQDSRHLARNIVLSLLEIVERDEQIGHVLEVALETLPNSTDDDNARALLNLAVPYGIDSSNKFFELAGRVLVLLERFEVAQAEAAGAAS